MEIIKVSSKSSPNAVAGALANMIKQTDRIEMNAVGAGAINQAVKAIAIARGFVASGGIELVCIPSFVEISIEGLTRTAIQLMVERK